jgi:hypothetical protein
MVRGCSVCGWGPALLLYCQIRPVVARQRSRVDAQNHYLIAAKHLHSYKSQQKSFERKSGGVEGGLCGKAAAKAQKGGRLVVALLAEFGATNSSLAGVGRLLRA